MRRTLLALIIFLSLSFSLNVSSSLKENEIVFSIDGKQYEKTNLTLFLFKDGVQIRGVQRNDVLLPYSFFVPYSEGGIYELRVIDSKNNYGSAAVNITIEQPSAPATETKADLQGTEWALIASAIGILVLVYFFVSFIKGKSYKK